MRELNNALSFEVKATVGGYGKNIIKPQFEREKA